MTRTRIVALTLAGLAAAAGGYLALRQLGVFAAPSMVKAVPAGDQEIVFLAPATSSAEWERLVEALRRVRKARPELQIDDREAFPEQSADVPELALRMNGGEHRLWIRWYKITDEMTIEKWVKELCSRSPPPLAIIGGANSSDARTVARELNKPENLPAEGKPPLLLITTATADRIRLQSGQGEPLELIKIHPGRTFRFCFTNSQMADGVVDFVWKQPELRRGDVAPLVRLFAWSDNPYSTDLAWQFKQQFEAKRSQAPLAVPETRLIADSVGGQSYPNPSEATAVEELVAELREPGGFGFGMLVAFEQPVFVVLPVGTAQARRFAEYLAASAPRLRNVVLLSGDSINFNAIYRDRDVSWSVPEVPVHLVFFSHENPMDKSVQQGDTQSGTQDLLLYVSIFEKVLAATFENGGRGLAANSDALAERLRQAQGGFFDASGNRKGGRGEYIVWLRPRRKDGRLLPDAELEIWTRVDRDAEWKRQSHLTVDYGERARGGS